MNLLGLFVIIKSINVGLPFSQVKVLTKFLSPLPSIQGGLDGGSRIRYSITNFVLIRDSISEISP